MSNAPPPPSKLGEYRVLSSRAGVHVSPLQLGAMSIGEKWADKGMGSMDKASSLKLLDTYFDLGGNFIDTACGYQDETSEMFIGEWAEQRGIRDQLVIATKYSAPYKTTDNKIDIKINYNGNSVKNLHVCVEASLKKLRTTYIDILYVHFWDYATSVEEVMDGLHHLVAQGKVLYLGISDAPAWVVMKANQYARYNGKTPFVIYQGAWNVISRDFERDIIPMARDEGMALAPWNVLAQGRLRSDEEERKRQESGEGGRTFYVAGGKWTRSEVEIKASHALEKVAKEVGTEHVSAVAIAYVMQKTPFVFPVIGGRKVEHLKANIEALNIALSKDQIEYLESIVPFDPGFPHNMIGDGTDYNAYLRQAGNYVKQPVLQPIIPSKN
ncbi:hypothetical protein PC9H_008234 [Pleurotus ostreatus]|uniref:NADP-dependent oxidoreductase domain-containing protein n=1 Tax=Pleurotus ostreatus TaxID=5322 RepID=A0A8H6ZVG2_PLEOS|nr:uncharacterized protein PC9H_008234 [Pleurotus ostreatus]KAF7428996.1 hypothetical protein PC9H_008234 [Pleurotus ostreatus]